MVLDVRAIVSTSLPGELISATISDSSIPGAGLIKTTGTALMKGGGGGSGEVTFTIIRPTEDEFIIPRLLYIISYAYDPLRDTTQYELGCQLTIKENVRENVVYTVADAPTISICTNNVCVPQELEDIDKCFDIATIQLEARNIVNWAVNKVGLSTISGLINKFSIKEFDVSAGYIPVVADLEFSEGRLIHQDQTGPFIAEAYLVGGAINPRNIRVIDSTPVTSSEIPGQTVIANYSTLKLLDADPDKDAKDLNWEEEETIGSKTFISVRYESGDDVWESSFAYIPYQKTETFYDKWERVVRRVTTTTSIGAAVSPNYVQALIQNDFDQGSGILGAASLSFGNDVFTTTTTTEISYVIPFEEIPPGECNFNQIPPPEGYEEVEQETTTVVEPYIALAGSIPGNFFDEDGNLDTIPGGTLVTSVTTITYDQQWRNVRVNRGADEEGNVKIKRIGSFPVTKTKTHYKKAYAYTSYGQMELAQRARQGNSIGELLGAASRLCDGEVEMRIVTGREAAVQIRPSYQDRIFDYYADKGSSDSNDNGFGTERQSESVRLSLTTYSSATGMIEITIPYSSDDKFVRIGIPPDIEYKAEPADPNPAWMAEAVAQAQAQLIIGAKSGLSVQTFPEDIPGSHIAHVSIQGGIYLVNNRTYTLTAEGAVASFDGIAIAQAGGDPGKYFPVAPGVSELPPITRKIGFIDTIENDAQAELDAAFPNAQPNDAVQRADNYDYWVYDGSGWVFKGPSPGAVIINKAPSQILGTIATVGSTPQTALSNAFPSAEPEDGVRALDTNTVWVYNGTTWIDEGQNPGEVLELTPGSTANLFNVTVSNTFVVCSRVNVTKFEYGLSLLTIVTPVSVKTQVVVQRVIPAATGAFTFTGQDAQLRVTRNLTVNAAVFTLTGQAVRFLPARLRPPGPGEFTLGLQPAALSYSGGDPYWNQVGLLLHMDGTNLSTTFTDSGPLALSGTVEYEAKISTARSKFGGASGYFDGTYDRIVYADNNAWHFGANDFTIESWVFCDDTGDAVATQWDANDSYSYGWGFYAYSNRLVFWYSTVGSDYYEVLRTFATENISFTWAHVAVCRSGTSIRMFLNGVQVGSTYTIGSSALYNSGTNMHVGNDGGTQYSFEGNLDDLRITKAARYTANFTPPSSAFPNGPQTV